MGRRLAILIETSTDSDDMTGLRRLLKILLRQYGLRCLAIKPPNETQTFSEPAPPAEPVQPSPRPRRKRSPK